MLVVVDAVWINVSVELRPWQETYRPLPALAASTINCHCVAMDLTQLTDLMDELSRQTWFNLTTARRLKMRMGEVTATEINLLAMSRLLEEQNIPAELIPTRADEATTGVDFEIWLDVGGQRFFGYAIQAKILTVRKDKFTFPQLSHHDGMGSFQYQLLEKHAQATGSRPVHLFYNGWESGTVGAPPLPSVPSTDHFGCAAVMTSAVRRIRMATTKNHTSGSRASVKASDYLDQAMPWSDLFRLPGVPNSITPGPAASPSSPQSSSAPSGDSPRRSVGLTLSEVDALEHHIDEISGEGGVVPRRALKLPDYVVRARGLHRSQLSRARDLPLYALVIHS